MNNKGVALKNLGRYQEAIEEYDKALKIEPNNVASWENEGFALFKLNRLDETIQCANKVIEADTSNASAWYNRSCYLAKKVEINEALKNLEEAIRLDKKYLESAKTDTDFDLIRDNTKFKELVRLR